MQHSCVPAKSKVTSVARNTSDRIGRSIAFFDRIYLGLVAVGQRTGFSRLCGAPEIIMCVIWRQLK
jgi:hypothetical protein